MTEPQEETSEGRRPAGGSLRDELRRIIAEGGRILSSVMTDDGEVIELNYSSAEEYEQPND